MKKAIDDLKDGLDRCEKYYLGPAGKGYKILAENPEGDRRPVTWRNEGLKTDLVDPQPGDRLPGRYTSAGLTIVSVKEYRLPETDMALDELKKSRTSSNDLDRLTQDDLDDLIDLTEALADSMAAMEKIAFHLNLSQGELRDMRSSLEKSSWYDETESPVRRIYIADVNHQLQAFVDSEASASNIKKANSQIAGYVIDMVEGLVKLARARRKAALGVVTDILTAPAGGWKGLAINLTEKIKKWDSNQGKDVTDSLHKLSGIQAVQTQVEEAQKVEMNWPEAGTASKAPEGAERPPAENRVPGPEMQP